MSLQFILVDSNWCHRTLMPIRGREEVIQRRMSCHTYLQECSTTPHSLFSHCTLARNHVDFLLSYCRNHSVHPVFILPNPFVNGLTFQAVYKRTRPFANGVIFHMELDCNIYIGETKRWLCKIPIWRTFQRRCQLHSKRSIWWPYEPVPSKRVWASVSDHHSQAV